MAELLFADGPREVDDELVEPIREAAGGDTQAVTFKVAMKALGGVEARNYVREHARVIVRDHLSRYGLR